MRKRNPNDILSSSSRMVMFLFLTMISFSSSNSSSMTQVSSSSTSTKTSLHFSLKRNKPAFVADVWRGGGILSDYDDDEDEYSSYDDDEQEEVELKNVPPVVTKKKVEEPESEPESELESETESELLSEYDDEEEEEEGDTIAQVLQAKSIQNSKAAINVSLQQTKPRKKRRQPRIWLPQLPYIVRACLNPITVLTMTKAYFASLFNISYLEEDSAQGLRSALQAKAKKSDGKGGGKRGKRQMKPGQAKTLSDLPQLSA